MKFSQLKKTVQALGRWQKHIVTSQKTHDGDEIPHPAAAPISTDQEAGGASTTPDKKRIYEKTRKPQDTEL